MSGAGARRSLRDRLPRVASSPILDASEAPHASIGTAGVLDVGAEEITTQEERDVSMVLRLLGDRARARALALSPDQRVTILAQSAQPWDHATVITVWGGGTYDTTDGERVPLSLEDFGSALVSYAELINVKGSGVWFSPALSRNGRCRDEDAEAITQLILDCDLAGDWFQLRAALDACGLAYVLQRSSSHTPTTPKWHVHLFLAEYLCDLTKAEWRAVYRHLLAWLSVVAGLQCDPHSRHLKFRYGFDPKADRMIQPWFAPARRADDQPVPEVVCQDGAAFDVFGFLLATAFVEETARAEVEVANRSRNRALDAGSRAGHDRDFGGIERPRTRDCIPRSNATLDLRTGWRPRTLRRSVRPRARFRPGPDLARELLQAFNERCLPPWEDARLDYKVREAYFRSTRPFGYLLAENRLNAAIRRTLEKRSRRQT